MDAVQRRRSGPPGSQGRNAPSGPDCSSVASGAGMLREAVRGAKRIAKSVESGQRRRQPDTGRQPAIPRARTRSAIAPSPAWPATRFEARVASGKTPGGWSLGDAACRSERGRRGCCRRTSWRRRCRAGTRRRRREHPGGPFGARSRAGPERRRRATRCGRSSRFAQIRSELVVRAYRTLGGEHPCLQSRTSSGLRVRARLVVAVVAYSPEHQDR